ncbi:MAG: hypothetical protein CMN32_05395 [Saprospirales bacterium]|nr:hypothetical protein [Saprospirales bacterium]
MWMWIRCETTGNLVTIFLFSSFFYLSTVKELKAKWFEKIQPIHFREDEEFGSRSRSGNPS